MIIKDLEELKESEPREYEKLHFQNIHSLVTVPLIENDAVMGFFGVDNPPVQDLENTTAILNILAYFSRRSFPGTVWQTGCSSSVLRTG